MNNYLRKEGIVFNKDLFLSLCEKYDVELSANAVSPMIKEGEQTHAITTHDVNCIFTLYPVYFEYYN